MRKLLASGRRLLVRGRKLLLDTPECRAACCGGCSLWFHAEQCRNPTGCVPFPIDQHLYICADVPCQDGRPLTIGQTFKVSGVCWTITETVPIPPPGADIYPGKLPVQCAAGCTDPICPAGELYYPAIPCGPIIPGAPPIYVCGVTRCETRSCHTLDPSVGGVPLDQVPEGGIIRTLDEMGPVQASCCECEPSCETQPMVNFIGRDCYENVPRNRMCCCTIEFPVRGRIRMVQWQTTQRRRDINGDRFDNFTVVSESLDDAGCPTYQIRWVRTQDGSPVWDIVIQQAPPCLRCGNWPIGPDMRLAVAQIVSAFGGDCHDIQSAEYTLTVLAWANTYSCTRMHHSSAYHYTDLGGDIITTTFEAIAELVDLGRCGTPCGGGIVHGGIPGIGGGVIDIGAFLP